MLALVLAAALSATGAPSQKVAPALAVTLPTPGPLAPTQDPGPFGSRELAGAFGGVALGDALVVAAGYTTLQLFAHHTIDPNAQNFRHTAMALGVGALVAPPLLATLFGNWASPGPRGHLWRAMLLGLAAQLAAGAAGYAAAPNYWVALPVQLVVVTVGTSLGLHLGRITAREPPQADADAAAPAGDPDPTPRNAPEPVRASLPTAMCPVT